MRFPDGTDGMTTFTDRMWPVGSVFTSVVATNPADLLGIGVWEEIGAGRVLVGQDAGQAEFDTLGETGGAKTHTLGVGEMPSHTHTQDSHTHAQNAHTHGEQLQGGTTGTTTGTHLMGSAATGGSLRAAGQSTAAATAVNQNATAVNQNTGGGAAHNNLQPYLVVRFWKRTA